eukprot:3382649-Rhodomonas_salina.1
MGESKSGECGSGESETGELTQKDCAGPFQNILQNEVWRELASQMMDNYEQLADIDTLEPNPAHHKEAMQNPRLKPFWIESEQMEMDGLWRRGCFKRWKRKDLLPTD